MQKDEMQKRLSALPKVDKILEHERVRALLSKIDKPILKKIVQTMLSEKRSEIKRAVKEKKNVMKVKSTGSFIDELEEKVRALLSPKLKRVINATGTVLHTNLGRAPIDKGTLKEVLDLSSGYSNLEFDLNSGKRGSRYSHFEEAVRLVTGAEATLAVNNNAAAVLLVLNTFCEGKEAVVSRGELIEIGGSFRIPEVMKKSQTLLREVGTTNKTNLKDYEKAINLNTGLLLKVHTSNYKILGFTEEVSLNELVSLGKKKRVIVYNDLGSGCLVDLCGYGMKREDTVQDALNSGVDIVSFSGDKLLGGPQAGIIVGKKKYIDKIKKNPLTRALRLDKITVHLLYLTFMKYFSTKSAVRKVPALRMLILRKNNIKKRCDALFVELKRLRKKGLSLSVKEDVSYIGGGALPLEKIETYVIIMKCSKISCAKLSRMFREYPIPIIVRVADNSIILDIRTVLSGEEKIIKEAVRAIF